MAYFHFTLRKPVNYTISICDTLNATAIVYGTSFLSVISECVLCVKHTATYNMYQGVPEYLPTNFLLGA